MTGPRIDLKGQRFGGDESHLDVIGFAHMAKNGAVWWCRCVCGKEVRVSTVALRHNGRTHCGCQSWTPERRTQASERMKAIPRKEWTPERKAAIKASWTPERRALHALKLKALWTAERRKAAAQEVQARKSTEPKAPIDWAAFWTPEKRQEASRRARARWANPELSERMKAAMKAAWTDQKRLKASRSQQRRWTPERKAAAKAAAKERWLASPPNRKIDQVEPGAKYGWLTVLRSYDDLFPEHGASQRMWICECRCGKLCVRRADKLAYMKPRTRTSCGCARIAALEQQIERMHGCRARAEDQQTRLLREQSALAAVASRPEPKD